MLFFIFSRISFNKTNMSTHFITIISEINKFANLIIRMWLMGRKDCNNRVSTYAIESICIAGNDTLQCMVFQNIFLKGLFVFGLAGHGRLRNNYRSPRFFGQGIEQVLHER